jgi:hypothetical protein
MAKENIQLGINQGAFEKYDGFYYIMDHSMSSSGALIVRTDDGHTAFIYNTDTNINAEGAVLEIHYDGYYFWTLQQLGTPPASTIYIRKWAIQDFLCTLIDTLILSTAADYYNCATFAIEHYHREVAVAASGTLDNSLTLDSTDFITAGEALTIHIGPSSSIGHVGEWEEKTITGVSDPRVEFGSTLTHSYEVGDPCHVSKCIWLFNNYYMKTTGSALYEIDLDGNILNRTSGSRFGSVTASTFATYNYYEGSTPTPFLMYMKGAQLFFVDYTSAELPALLSSTQDIYKYATPTTSWTVYSLAIDDVVSDAEVLGSGTLIRDTIYRLQDGATYGTSDYTWSSTNKNYAITTVKPFVNSISVSAIPAVISADGTSTSEITTYVRDQYNNPLQNITVNFTEDDGVSTTDQVDPDSAVTNPLGKTVIDFTAGVADKLVTITATVNQVIV